VISELLSKALAGQASATKLEEWLAREAPDIARADVRRLAELLEDYLNSVPSALDALTSMAKQPPYGRSVAFAAGQVLVYFVDEEDLFPDAEFGALGLLDDAYLIHACLAALCAAFPELSVPAGYAPPNASALAAVRSLLPAGVPDALDRTCENLVRVAAALYAGGGQVPSAPEPPRSTLRVSDALAALSPDA
jgi:uncharacterized membrane protein YkvA (DUF1232 family)